jgi:3,4-dihydroxy 2-butanone 4-phosphate synthase / GTP cyclohydrolase II
MPGAVAVAAVLDRRGLPIRVSDARRDRRRRALALVPRDELLSRALAASLADGGVECSLPTRDGVFRAVASAPSPAGAVIVALVHGEVDGSLRVPVYEHVHCLLGDTFASSACGCRASLDRAVGTILSRGTGVILYLKLPVAAVPPLTCPRGVAGVDPAVAAGLLAHLGVESATLI